MNYTVTFKKGKNLGAFKIKGEDIDVYIKTKKGKVPEVMKGVKYYDPVHARYSALAIAMENLNNYLKGENITVKLEDWMNKEISYRIIENELSDVEMIKYIDG